MSAQSTLAEVNIQVEGYDRPVNFNMLSIDQQLADVNHFSFNWRQEQGEGSLSVYVTFNKNYLAKEVTININNEFTFKGIICSINCIEQDFNGITYEITGQGLFVKLNEVQACNSFYQKDLNHIFNTLNATPGTTLQLNPALTDPLFYTVQYNQSAFDLYKMLATRYGEWLYYNGQELVLGPPQGEATNISDTEIDGLTFRSRIQQPPVHAVNYDSYQGQVIQSNEQAAQPGGTSFIATNLEAGSTIIPVSSFSNFSMGSAPTEGLLSSQNLLLQKAAAAASTIISGHTHNSKLKLAGKINITDNEGNHFGAYIITALRHQSSGPTNYHNYFSAIPAEAEVPPYTNPLVHAPCPTQVAVVIENEDPDHQERVKVRFPWQPASETTPWLKVVTPYAGSAHGFRFLPEIDDLVFVDFVNNNPDFPFVAGSFYTENRQAGGSYDDYKAKVFGTVSGRRMEINDDTHIVKIVDNVSGEKPINALHLSQADSRSYITIQSTNDKDENSLVFVDADKGVSSSVSKGNDTILEITLDRNTKKITIKSKGDISLNAGGNISMSASEISMNASKNIKMKASEKINLDADEEIKIDSVTVKVEANSTLEMGAVNAKLEADVQLDLTCQGITNLKGLPVNIN